jgi:predicted RNA methylase
MSLSLKRFVGTLSRAATQPQDLQPVHALPRVSDSSSVGRLLQFEPKTAPLTPCQRRFFSSTKTPWEPKHLEGLCADLERAGVTSFRPDPIRASLSFKPGYFGSPQVEDGVFLPWRLSGLASDQGLKRIVREAVVGADHLYWAVCMGHRFVVDHRVARTVAEAVAHPVMPIIMNTVRGPTVVRFTAPAVAMMDHMPWQESRVADLGSAEGLLTVIALEHGAQAVLAIDLNGENAARLQKNIELAGLNPEKATFVAEDIENNEIKNQIVDFSPDTVLANLGPHYGTVDLTAIDIAGTTASVNRLLLAGYADMQGRFSPEVALTRARAHGFEYELHYLNISAANAFIAVLMTRP